MTVPEKSAFISTTVRTQNRCSVITLICKAFPVIGASMRPAVSVWPSVWPMPTAMARKTLYTVPAMERFWSLWNPENFSCPVRHWLPEVPQLMSAIVLFLSSATGTVTVKPISFPVLQTARSTYMSTTATGHLRPQKPWIFSCPKAGQPLPLPTWTETVIRILFPAIPKAICLLSWITAMAALLPSPWLPVPLTAAVPLYPMSMEMALWILR